MITGQTRKDIAGAEGERVSREFQLFASVRDSSMANELVLP